MNLMKSVRNAALAVLMLSAGVANAGLYEFKLTGDYSATWQLDSTVVPDIDAPDIGFVLWDVEGSFPGSLFDATDLYFYSTAQGGGLEIEDFWGELTLLVAYGEQLYTGPEFAPTFKLGTFGLSGFDGIGSYSLTITDLDAAPEPAPVPEPATAAMLLGGLGLLYATRKRRFGK